jgi:RimJ/RimL family protein N-acetyltransferase
MVGGPTDDWQAWRGFTAALGHWMLKGYGFWTIARKSDNAPMGKTGFINHPSWDEPELGWHLYEEFIGQNYAFEATTAARAYGPQFGLDGVISYIDPANERSLRLAKRLGATLERLGNVLGKPCMIYRHPKVGG